VIAVPEWALFLIGFVLTVGTGFFVASEFSLVSLDRADLEARRERGERGLSWTIGALKRTSTHLSSAQLGITLTTLLAGYTLEPALTSWLTPAFVALGAAEAAVRPIATVLAVALATLLSMIIGELVPKGLALSAPLPTARIVVPFQVVFTATFRHIVAGLNGTAGAVLRLFGIEQREELSSARTAEELASLVRRSATKGSLEQDTATLLTRTLLFSGLTAADVMTPRPRLVTIDIGDSAQDVIELSKRTGHSRFPVEDGSIDELVSVVHLKQAIAVPRAKRSEVPVGAIATEALRVPETMHLDALLSQLRRRGYQMAIVLDEYGGTAGIATLEDLVEEIVGEVDDEHDRSRSHVITRHGSTTFPGILRPDELRAEVGLTVPDDGPYETVAGWMMSELGHIPRVGDTVETEEGSYRVTRLDGRRVDRIRFTPRPVAEGDSQDAAKDGDRR